MARLKRSIIKHGMNTALQFTAFIARRKSLTLFNNLLLRKLASKQVNRVQNRLSDSSDCSALSVKELGHLWQQAFPSAKQVPLIDITENTVYAEIQTPCPLKDSGDLNACYRMMEYDRAYIKKFGGQFVVLESQAEAGITKCKVAIQKSDDHSAPNLIHAHLRPSLSQYD